jgi:uncharacterized repeat protein (TIGR03803 family)
MSNSVQATIITNLYSFGISPNAWGPRDTLTQNSNGLFYGTTPGGGPTGVGAIFSITRNGIFTSLAYFSGTNGSLPYGRLVLGPDGDYYGTTSSGGIPDTNGDVFGTVFKVTLDGTITSLASFAGTNGWNPIGGLVLGSDGCFYGTTEFGGPTYNTTIYPHGYGTVFKVDTNAMLTTLAVFDGTNGAYPVGALLEVADGVFYGTTSSGGISNVGTIFQVTADGAITAIASFKGTNGSGPQAGLIRARDDCFYGTTLGGGTSTNTQKGTVFKLGKDGSIHTLYSFTAWPDDGASPLDALVQGPDGNLYGTTRDGGQYDMGVIFQTTSDGRLTTLYSFHAYFELPRDGGQPYAGFVHGDDGYFYGTTRGAGASGGGTFFRFAAPPNLQIAPSTGRTMAISWNSVIGGLYQLQYTTNIDSINWIVINSNFVATNTTPTNYDVPSPDFQRFYRMLQLQ